MHVKVRAPDPLRQRRHIKPRNLLQNLQVLWIVTVLQHLVFFTYLPTSIPYELVDALKIRVTIDYVGLEPVPGGVEHVLGTDEVLLLAGGRSLVDRNQPVVLWLPCSRVFLKLRNCPCG